MQLAALKKHMAEAYMHLRIRDLLNSPPEVLAGHFETWFAERLARSEAHLVENEFVGALKRAAKAATLLTAETRHTWINVDVVFNGTGVTCARVEAATRWLGLECVTDRTTPCAQNKRLVKVRRLTDRTHDIREYEEASFLFPTADLTALELHGQAFNHRGRRSKHDAYAVSCDACGVENGVAGIGCHQTIMAHRQTDRKYCDECLTSGKCEDDPDYGYSWEPYYYH